MKHGQNRRRASARNRRGSVYVFVLLTASFVTAVGLAGVAASRVQLRTSGSSDKSTAARLSALAAIEIGIHMVRNDTNWRSTLGSGNWITDQPFADGTFSLDAIFDDLADSDPDNDKLTLTGTGVYGQSVHKTEVSIVGGLTPEQGSWAQALP